MQAIDARAKAAGLSLARLAREAGVGYRRIFEAANLRPDEVYRLEVVLQAAEKKTAPGATRGAVKEAAVGAATSTET